MISPFLHPGPSATAESLAILHLRRDHLLPTTLHEPHQGETQYDEGHVANTRFGSYPHSTFIGLPWGSQVLASQVDTGSRSKATRGKKRKLAEVNDGEDDVAATLTTEERDKQAKAPVVAASGFCHILPPTPETWTVSLPHRTQVVYTPDYSFVLQKLQVRPGSVVIEAGAGSGSFTHAATRAVFDGYPEADAPSQEGRKDTTAGRVYSFEYHEPRAKQLQEEIKSHGLSDVVRVTHRDVYKDGFMLPPHLPPQSTIDTNSANEAHSPVDTKSDQSSANMPTTPDQPMTDSAMLDDPSPTQPSPLATSIFLDLPAPWLALPHLTRSRSSPLDPNKPAHLCAFLPCIEQVTRTITSLRQHSWLEIRMYELSHRRLDVRRERVGLSLEGLRGVNAVPATVAEAVERLVEVEKVARARAYASAGGKPAENGAGAVNGTEGNDKSMEDQSVKTESRAARLARIAKEAAGRKPWEDGRVVVKTEPEIKTHTSYLVFAVLPVEWSEEMERLCREKWPVKHGVAAGQAAEEGEAGGKRQKGKRGKRK